MPIAQKTAKYQGDMINIKKAPKTIAIRGFKNLRYKKKENKIIPAPPIITRLFLEDKFPIKKVHSAIRFKKLLQ